MIGQRSRAAIPIVAMSLSEHRDRWVVLDAFAGSGSTLIACKDTGRQRGSSRSTRSTSTR
jgi:hypothetical protein